MKKTEYTGYISKTSGKNGLYKIIARFTTKEGVKRVRLQGFGKTPFEFWADESALCAPPEPKRRPGEETQTCWECGCDFTWRECKANDGNWNESYCGC